MGDINLLSAGLTGDAPAAAAQGALIDRSALALIAVERTRMAMVIVDVRLPDMPIVLANKAFLDLTGWTADEVIGRNSRFMQGPGTSPAAIAEIRSAIANERVLIIELLNYRKNGEAFWNQLHLDPIHDRDGRLIYVFGSLLDVTARRKAQSLEAAEIILLREVDHRAKNALALVQGIVRLTRADDPAAYAEAVEGRVGSLARAHTLLADRHWASVSLRQLIHGEIEALGVDRVLLAGDPVQIDPAQVQPLALLLHELVVNAVQHGALSAAPGSVAIRWHTVDDGRLVIEMVESGGPPPASKRRTGFGSAIVDAVVRRQLRGSVELDWRAEGLVTVVAIPPAPAERPPLRH